MRLLCYRVYYTISLIYFSLSLLLQDSVNAHASKIPYPWLVFNEKIKVNSVFLGDSTAVSDSMLLLFGVSVSMGDVSAFALLLCHIMDIPYVSQNGLVG